jgi:hypothetical protein
MFKRRLQTPSGIGPKGVTSSATLSESGRVRCWRLARLVEAGYGDDATAALATPTDVDLHQATAMLLHGHPQTTTLRILLYGTRPAAGL